MSEYGCITNGRNFEETTALYQPDMTKVFSGGLVYEYAQEANGYGLVTISGSTVTPVGNQVTDLKNALAKASDPTDGGGYTTSSTEQQCPDQSTNWDTSPYTGTALPAFPSGAETYMKNGAGTGPGLTGAGSQNAGGGTPPAQSGSSSSSSSSGSSSGSSSSASSTSTHTHKSAANAVQLGQMDMAPFVCGAVVMVSMLFGASLL